MEKTKRYCLKCNKAFPSKGIVNRLCDQCNTTNRTFAGKTGSCAPIRHGRQGKF